MKGNTQRSLFDQLQGDTRLQRSVMVTLSGLLLLLCVAVVYSIYQDYQASLRKAFDKLQIQVHSFANTLDMAFIEADHTLQETRDWLQHDPELLHSRQHDLRKHMMRDLLEAPFLTSLVLYGSDGKLLVGVGRRDLIHASAPQSVLTGMHQGADSMLVGIGNSIGITLGVHDRGQRRAVLLAVIDENRILSAEDPDLHTPGLRLSLLNAQGTVLYPPAGRRYQQEGVDTQPMLDLQGLGFEGSGTRLFALDDWLYGVQQLRRQPVSAVGRLPRTLAFESWRVRSLKLGSVCLLLVLLAVGFLLYWHRANQRSKRASNDLLMLYQAINQMPNSFLITDLDSRIRYVNKTFLHRTGYSEEQVLGQSPGILNSGLTPAANFIEMRRVLQSGGVWQGEFVNRMKSGEIRYDSAIVAPIRDIDGEVCNYFSITSDITESRAIEQRLRRAKVIVSASTELLSLVDREYRYIQVNDAYSEFHQRAKSEIEGMTISELLGEGAFNGVKPIIDQAFQGKVSHLSNWFESPAKGKRFCSVTFSPVPGERRGVDYVVITVSDITERKKSEEAVHTNEMRFRALSEFSPNGVFESDGRGLNIYANERVAKIFGLSMEQIAANGWADAIHPDEREAMVASWLDVVQNGRKEWYREARVLRPNGEVRWVECSARRHEDPDGETRYIGIVRDVTEHVQYQETLKQKNRDLQALSTTDHLTGLANRSRLEAALQHEIDRSARYRSDCAVIMVDVDHFKRVNDTFGHQVGDEVLVRIARILQENTRKTDLPGRWGGEEFLVICPECNARAAEVLAEQLRAAIERTNFPSVGHKTASFGVADITQNCSVKDVLKRVDKALYEAKGAGRNRVVRSDAYPAFRAWEQEEK